MPIKQRALRAASTGVLRLTPAPPTSTTAKPSKYQSCVDGGLQTTHPYLIYPRVNSKLNEKGMRNCGSVTLF